MFNMKLALTLANLYAQMPPLLPLKANEFF